MLLKVSVGYILVMIFILLSSKKIGYSKRKEKFFFSYLLFRSLL